MRRLTAVLLLFSLMVAALPLPGAPGERAWEGDRSGVPSAYAQTALPPPPNGWPGTLQLGISSGRGEAASMKATTGFGFRYQYLAGGVNTNQGWYTWNSNGSFVTDYIQESVTNGMVPFFSYYMLLQSKPGATAEDVADYTNLNTTSTMQAYYNDLKLFFQKAAAYPNTKIVLQVEPDLWGYMQQRARNDDASTVSAKVAATGLAELAGLPDTVPGFAQAVVKLRDTYARNVVLGYHLSVWGTGNDIVYSNPPDSTVDGLAARSGNFYLSLHAPFDFSTAEFSDRDSAFKQYVYGDGGASWWDSADFSRNVRYLTKFVGVTQKRVVMWQIPYGNTKMLAMNNTWDHYQDNRVEWLLDDPIRAHLTEYVNAGVIAFLFGRGADGATCACDANGDGVTNPAAINGNTGPSLNADDDGGFFRQKAAAYYQLGAIPLSGGSTVPTVTPTPIPSGSATPTPTVGAQPGYSTGATVSPTSVPAGANLSISASVTSAAASTVLVDAEVYDPGGTKVFQQWFDNEVFSAGQQKTYALAWQVPASAVSGTYTVKIGIFSPNWGTLYAWNDAAAQFAVTASAATSTPTAVPSPTATPTPKKKRR